MSGSTPQKPASGLILSIIIVNWNTRELLAQCLQSISDEIRTLRRQGVETLVVDNASTDGSAGMVREHFPWVKSIENQKNVGFAHANNQAILESTGRYVLLLNPDTLVKPGAFEILIDFMETHPRAGAAGAQLLNPDGTLQVSCYPAPTLGRELWRMFHLDALRPYGVYNMDEWDRNTSREVEIVQGACLILRDEALDQIGLLDGDYFIYSEEVDLCHRLAQADWRLYWVPQARVVHYGGQSTQQMAAEMFLQLYRGKILYFRKHYGRLTTHSYKVILFFATLTRLLISPLAWLERPAKRERHLTLTRHYRRLLLTLPEM
jgi:N-acetylglucosaminyl-diphospho-decaprenol L-rhamnosyltransferase